MLSNLYCTSFTEMRCALGGGLQGLSPLCSAFRYWQIKYSSQPRQPLALLQKSDSQGPKRPKSSGGHLRNKMSA